MSEKIGIGPKIKQLRQGLGLSRDAFAGVLGVRPNKIQDIERQAQRTPDDFVIQLVNKFDVDLDWLFEVSNQSSSPRGLKLEQVDPQKPGAGDVIIDGHEVSLVKRFQINVSAGPGIIPIDEEEDGSLAFSNRWLQRNGINEQLAGLVRVEGDSMEPTIPDGALVLVHIPEFEVKREAIYAFALDGEAFIKRLIPTNFDDDGRARSIAILSDNHQYPAQVLADADLNRVRVVGRVRCAMIDL